MEKFMFVFMAKYDFQNMDVFISNSFGIFGQSHIGSKQKTIALRLHAMLPVKISQKNAIF